ncbi:MAG: hypothetical protein LUH00_04950 [Lachnospiraceae bacterium]|nr:hypothetical protein [Lachnospiraceae bacterium]
MASVFSEVLEHFTNYFADSLYPLLFLLALLVIFFHPGAKKERAVLCGSNLLFLVIIFCPLTAYPVIKMIGSLVYWRMLWLLSLPITLAFALVWLVSGFSGKAARALTAVLASAAILCSGQFLFTSETFTARANYFKIPTEAIYVAESISAHAEEEGIENPKAVVPIALCSYIRQYDAGIRLAYGRNMVKGEVTQTKLYEEINSEAPRAKRLARLARKAECTYLVLPASLSLEEKLAKHSFVKIAEAGGYIIYFDAEYASPAANSESTQFTP